MVLKQGPERNLDTSPGGCPCRAAHPIPCNALAGGMRPSPRCTDLCPGGHPTTHPHQQCGAISTYDAWPASNATAAIGRCSGRASERKR
jgi:hypothetical protein